MLNPCRSNLLPILITLLSCAGLFLFFNLRLNELKITVEKQNRVLTSFITNVQQDIKAGGAAPPLEADVPSKHFAAPEALIAARKQEIDKIVVSDDEDDSESDSDSDSDSESDSDEDEDVQIKVVNLNTMQSMSFEPVSFEPVSFEPVSFEVLSFINNESSVSSITEIIEEPLNLEPTSLEPLNLEPLNLVNLIGHSEETTLGKSDGTKESYEQMKVDDLRKIVTDKNLSTKEEVKKLKKPELLLLLKK
jgi:hypothetical protein